MSVMQKLEVCPGRHCPGPCSADDCYIRRLRMGRDPMIWPEGTHGPEPDMSSHVESEIRRLFGEFD